MIPPGSTVPYPPPWPPQGSVGGRPGVPVKTGQRRTPPGAEAGSASASGPGGGRGSRLPRWSPPAGRPASSPGSGRLALFPPAPGRGLGPAAAASSSRCTQRLWAQLLGMSAESRRPLAGSPEPGQTSGLHWACSRGARREGRGRCRGSHGNCWARTRPRGAGGGAAAWCALGSAPWRAHTHARTPGRRHTHTHTHTQRRPAGGRARVCARPETTRARAHTNKHALTRRRAGRLVHALAGGHTDAQAGPQRGVLESVRAPRVHARARTRPH